MKVNPVKSMSKSDDDFANKKKKRQNRYELIEEIPMMTKTTKFTISDPKPIPKIVPDDGHSSTSDVSLSSASSITSHASNPQSSAGYGSFTGSPAPSRSQSPVRFRKVNRFGDDCQDTCLFPLTISLNEALENHKGPITWEIIMAKSENILQQWENDSQIRRQRLNNTTNKVLSSSHCAPMEAVEAETIFAPNVKLPLRRYGSEICLRIPRQERKTRKTERNRRRSVDIEESLAMSTFNSLPHTESNINKGSKSMLLKRKPIKRFTLPSFKESPTDKKTCSPRTKARRHISEMKLDNPLSVGVQLTNINKQLFLQLSPSEVFGTVMGKQHLLRKTNTYGIQSLMAFNEEVKRMVINVITAEKKPEAQSRKIAAFIEVSCVLRKLRNWNSLEVIIKTLQSPFIFMLEKAWAHTKSYYQIHFGDFLKLVQVVEACDKHLIRLTEEQPSIPSLKLYLRMMKVQCTAQYDLCESKRSWVEPRSIIGWVQNELNGTVLEKELQKEVKKPVIMPSLNPNKESLLPTGDPIRYIPLTALPRSWLLTELRGASSIHVRPLIHFFMDIFKSEMSLIQGYKCAKGPTESYADDSKKSEGSQAH